jgi:hypothetical protein
LRSWRGKEPAVRDSMVLVRREERAEAWRVRSEAKATAVRPVELSWRKSHSSRVRSSSSLDWARWSEESVRRAATERPASRASDAAMRGTREMSFA